MLTHILHSEQNAHDFEEQSLSMDGNHGFQQLSVSVQSYRPLSLNNDDSSKSLVAPATSGADSLVDPFNSISILESSGQTDNGASTNVRCDYVSEAKNPLTIRAPPWRRSTRMSKSKQRDATKKPAKQSRKLPTNKPLLDTILLNVGRRKRSGIHNRARSSAWGYLGNITQVFDHNAVLDFNQHEHEKSRTERGGGRRGKRIENQTGQNTQKRGKTRVSTNHIRLKIILGKGRNKSCNDVIPSGDNVAEKCQGTNVEFPKLTEDVEGKLNREAPSCMDLKCHNENLEKEILLSGTPLVDVYLADKDIAKESAGNTVDNGHGIPSRVQIERLAVTADNRCSDPGTSPDSEVINIVPDTQMSGNVPENLHDVLISSQACVAHGEVTSLSLQQTGSKKGKKKDKAHKGGNCNVTGRLSSPEIMDNGSIFEKDGQIENMKDGSFSSDASISTVTGNASGLPTTSEIFVREPPSLSVITGVGVSGDSLPVDGGIIADHYSGLDIGPDSPDSEISEKLHPRINSKGWRLPTNLSTKLMSKDRPNVHDPANRNKNCRHKRNKAKSASKHKAKEKGDGGQVVCKLNSQTETGNHALYDFGGSRSANMGIAGDISKLDVIASGVGEQYVPPWNAWVRCDDCHKWRRITTVLADSIEETNCRWICKDNQDKDFADCSIPQEKSNSEINAELELSDASCEEDACAVRSSNRSRENQSIVTQQSSWRLIKSNLFLHRSRKTQTIDEIMVCHCKPPSDGRMGCGDGCLNRMLNIECVRGTCPCGEICSNQQFQKRKYAKLKWLRCGKKGYGLQLLEDISQGQFLIEYVGEVLDMQAYEARQRDYAVKGHKHFYFMTLNGSEIIDACIKGNLGRFINHSCDPNCRTEKWMVNGEVCIGLFALRDIKKGEEVTFDYNYVRVFGAAAKKCVCGSSQCRGYIGGDPLNSEVIVQGDSDEEYPEPVMVNEDGEIDDNLGNTIYVTNSHDTTNLQTAESTLENNDNLDEHATAARKVVKTAEMESVEILKKDGDEVNGHTAAIKNLVSSTENEDSMHKFSCPASKMEMCLDIEGPVGQLSSSVPPTETSMQPADKTVAAYQYVEEKSKNSSLCSVQKFENSSQTTTVGKLFPSVTDTKRKSKSETKEDRRGFSKSRLLMKKSCSSSSVKKGKYKTDLANANKSLETDSRTHLLLDKSKKPLEGSLNGRFEAVQEKLNELLDGDGGISKRKDASRGYLKLLLLTAASGDSGSGETIQSNRDLSMILDALLKTKSRAVLVDIINKNGLQMLHNIMKRYRREFNKIPILRKLLKILEYLAVREILSLEQINGGPPRPGVESFRESILTLTEHIDKQVHQIARNFRDKWIPRPMRKHSCMDRDDDRVESNRGSNCNRFSASQDQWCDQTVRPMEATQCDKQSILATAPVDAGKLDGSCTPCSSGCASNVTKTRKRKSRWDQPAETTDPRSTHNFGTNMVDNGRNCNEDIPPGFAPVLCSPLVPSDTSSTVVHHHQENVRYAESPSGVVTGLPQERFNSRLSVSYGIPLPIVQQFGTSQAENVDNWLVAPGMPFHPFPPLPPYPRDRTDPSCQAAKPMISQLSERDQQDHHNPANYSDQNTPSSSNADPTDVEMLHANGRNYFQRERSSSYSLGRKYFRQQKWNSSNLGPPWIRKRNGWGLMGNNSRNRMYNIGIGSGGNGFKGPYSSEEVRTAAGSSGNNFYEHTLPHC